MAETMAVLGIAVAAGVGQRKRSLTSSSSSCS
jgi:hypothetical protein